MTPFDAGIIVTLAGTGEVGYAGDGGPANRAVLADPFGCDFDSQGHLYMCDGRNHTVRRIDKDTTVITTVVGNGEEGYSGDGGQALSLIHI